MTIHDFKITDELINVGCNNNCIFCLEDINNINLDEENNKNESESVSDENINVESVDNINIKLNINRSKIILECNHNYHFLCFFKYIISKIKIYDEFLILKYKKFKCPLCQSNLDYSTVYILLKNYTFLVNNDLKIIRKEIYKNLLTITYKKVVFFYRNFLNKDIYLQELYNYYKKKENNDNLIKKKHEILTIIFLLKHIKIH